MKTQNSIYVFLVTLLLIACESTEPSRNKSDKRTQQASEVWSLRLKASTAQEFSYNAFSNISFGDSGSRVADRKTLAQRLAEYLPCDDTSDIVDTTSVFDVSMNFGDGCQSDDGSIRFGQINITVDYAGDTIRFETTYIDYREIDGDEKSPVINGKGENVLVFTLDGNINLQSAHSDLTLEFENDSTLLFTSSAKYDVTDHELILTEYTTKGSFVNGDSFSTSVIQSLAYDFNCPDAIEYPVKGVESVVYNENKFEIDYGNGNCDNDYAIK
jgi:hypothetical protein